MTSSEVFDNSLRMYVSSPTHVAIHLINSDEMIASEIIHG